MTTRRTVAAGVTAMVLGTLLGGCSTAAAPSPTTTPTPRIALPRTPTLYFLGDSWTTGYNAAPERGFPYVVGEALEAKVVLGPDSSGAGYTYTFNPYHPVFPAVTKTIDRIQADLIVLQGSVNDMPGPIGDLRDSIRETVRTLRTKSNGTPVVMVGPAPYQTEVPSVLTQIDRIEAATAAELHVRYISPLQEDWFTPGIVQSLIDTKQHPTTAGHAYFGGRLAADLKALTTRSLRPMPRTSS